MKKNVLFFLLIVIFSGQVFSAPENHVGEWQTVERGRSRRKIVGPVKTIRFEYGGYECFLKLFRVNLDRFGNRRCKVPNIKALEAESSFCDDISSLEKTSEVRVIEKTSFVSGLKYTTPSLVKNRSRRETQIRYDLFHRCCDFVGAFDLKHYGYESDTFSRLGEKQVLVSILAEISCPRLGFKDLGQIQFTWGKYGDCYHKWFRTFKICERLGPVKNLLWNSVCDLFNDGKIDSSYLNLSCFGDA